MNKKVLLAAIIAVTSGVAYAQSFPGTGVGPIPDGPGLPTACGVPGADLDITFAVTDVFAPLAAVEVDIEANHSWVGDLNVTLIAPDATEHVLFGATGSTTADGCGSGDDLLGVYNFSDEGTADWWALGTPYPVGDYQTTEAGGEAGSVGAATAFSAAFAAVADPNGTWTLRVTDGGGGDTGAVTAANLFLMGAANPDIIFEDGFEAPLPVL